MAKPADTAVLVRVMDDTGFNHQTIAKMTSAQSKQAVPLLSGSIAVASSFLFP
jgi:hypothetical protein